MSVPRRKENSTAPKRVACQSPADRTAEAINLKTGKEGILPMAEQSFMRVEEVAQELGVSKSYAYKNRAEAQSGVKRKGIPDHFRAGKPQVFSGKSLLWRAGKEGFVMAVYKEEKTNTWRVIYRYTDWTGERKQSQKRGFKTKREALAWEREQLNKTTADLDMTFASFVEQYTADMKTRIKENTWATKDHIIRTKLLPYFGKVENVQYHSAADHHLAKRTAGS